MRSASSRWNMTTRPSARDWKLYFTCAKRPLCTNLSAAVCRSSRPISTPVCSPLVVATCGSVSDFSPSARISRSSAVLVEEVDGVCARVKGRGRTRKHAARQMLRSMELVYRKICWRRNRLPPVRAERSILSRYGGYRDAAPPTRGSLAIFVWSDFNFGRELEESGNLETRHAGNPAGQVLHLVGEFFVYAPGGFVDRGSDQILQHLLVFVGENVGLDAYINKLLLPIHFYGNHAATSRSFHGYGVYLPLQVFLQLLEPGEHLLERVDFHQDSSGLRFTSVILPPKRCSIDFTIGSRSN